LEEDLPNLRRAPLLYCTYKEQEERGERGKIAQNEGKKRRTKGRFCLLASRGACVAPLACLLLAQEFTTSFCTLSEKPASQPGLHDYLKQAGRQRSPSPPLIALEVVKLLLGALGLDEEK